MKLPRFIFLCGPETPEKRLFADAFAKRNTSMLIEDFESPLREATVALFFNGDILNYTDPNKLAETRLPFPSRPQATDFIKDLKGLLETYSHNALGHVALQNYINNQFEELFDHILFRDTPKVSDAMPFVHKFGYFHTLCLSFKYHLTPGPYTKPIIQIIGSTVEEQLKNLDLSLEHLP